MGDEVLYSSMGGGGDLVDPESSVRTAAGGPFAGLFDDSMIRTATYESL